MYLCYMFMLFNYKNVITKGIMDQDL
jgi:hypothetical protein